jgi:hypothetical protein
MKSLIGALCGIGREWWWGEEGVDLTNVQCKVIQNCHNKSPLYNEYMIIKLEEKKSMVV